MKATINDVCIRGCEQRHSDKSGNNYLLVRFEDSTGKPYELADMDTTRQQYYTRDTQGDLQIDIVQGKYTKIQIIDFTIRENK